MASSFPWDPGLVLPVASTTRFIKGSRITWFYALWVSHKGDGWTIWLGCPKDKVVRLVRLFHRRQLPVGSCWTAPVIPLRPPLRAESPRYRQRP